MFQGPGAPSVTHWRTPTHEASSLDRRALLRSARYRGHRPRRRPEGARPAPAGLRPDLARERGHRGGLLPVERHPAQELDPPEQLRGLADLGQRLLGLRQPVRSRVRDHGPLQRHRVRRDHRSVEPRHRGPHHRAQQPLALHEGLRRLLLRRQRGRRRRPGRGHDQHRRHEHGAAASLARDHHHHRRQLAGHAHAGHRHGERLPLPRRRRLERHPHLRREDEPREPDLRRPVEQRLRPRGAGGHLHVGHVRRQADRVLLRRQQRRQRQHRPLHRGRHQQGGPGAAVVHDLPERTLLPPELALERPALRVHQRRARRRAPPSASARPSSSTWPTSPHRP